eukprot:350699-Chlamydomonas_euryale.AAC.10
MATHSPQEKEGAGKCGGVDRCGALLCMGACVGKCSAWCGAAFQPAARLYYRAVETLMLHSWRQLV